MITINDLILDSFSGAKITKRPAPDQSGLGHLQDAGDTSKTTLPVHEVLVTHSTSQFLQLIEVRKDYEGMEYIDGTVHLLPRQTMEQFAFEYLHRRTTL